MDPFAFNRQTIAFLGILALLEVLMVLVFPVLAIASALVAFILLVFVWLKAGVRTGKWLWWNMGKVPLTQAEGAIAVSAALLFASGLLVGGYEGMRYASGERTLLVGYALRHTLGQSKPPDVPARPAGMRGTHYSDPDMQTALKAELTRAGIPHKLDTTDGKEFVMWAPENDAAVEKIQQRVRENPSPTGHSVHFDKPETREAFKMWLLKRRIPFGIVEMRGKEYVTWKEGSKELAMQFLKEHYRPCPEAAAARDPGKAAQAPC